MSDYSMKPPAHYALVLLALSIVLAGGATAARLSFGESDNGKTVSAFPGDTIVLSLSENPSTGYRWVMETSGCIVLVSSSYTPSGTGRIGAAGTRVWRFMVNGTGSGGISAVYRQPWMPVSGSEGRFDLYVVSGKKNIPSGDSSPFFFKKTLQNTFFIPRPRAY
ncbi:MAG: protease inhibitor I42 family protein [Methanolinea sp.]|nr:protease inhibitor I42 family protein [Methanolinea sp.]